MYLSTSFADFGDILRIYDLRFTIYDLRFNGGYVFCANKIRVFLLVAGAISRATAVAGENLRATAIPTE